MVTQQQKYERFKALHDSPGCFIIPNPWDVASARLLSLMGFEALATTSAGYGFTVGKKDSFANLSRTEILDNAASIVAATDLPVSADLEDGFGPAPETCAETIKLACDLGLVGGSIEDATGDTQNPIFDLEQAIDRIRAAAESAKDRPFILTARAENYLCGRPDLKETITRLQAFSEAGADVLFAPGLPNLDAIQTVCRELDKPVNVVMGLAGANIPVTDLESAGVKRISVGGSFARAALGGLERAAKEVLCNGTFSYVDNALSAETLGQLLTTEQSGKRY